MLAALEGYDWQKVFEYAGELDEGGDTDGEENIEAAKPTSAVSLKPFAWQDVLQVIGMYEGERDLDSWLVAGCLTDGRWFFLEAGCCYTGWDCQAEGTATVAETRAELIQFGLTKEARQTFGIELTTEQE